MVQSYFSGIFQAVIVNSYQSTFVSVLKGVPQGSILGPVLLTLYIIDFTLGIPNNLIHQYAYDTIVYSVAPSADLALENVQSHFDIIEQALIYLKLLFNPKKTKCMLFTRSLLTDSSISALNGTPIVRVSSYKYLGNWINDKLVQATFLPVLDYAGVIYMHAALSTLKPLDAVYNSALCFVTGDGF